MIGNYSSCRSPKTERTVDENLRENWQAYKQKKPVTAQQAKVAGSMMACRTPQLGGRIDQCQVCKAWVFRFNSCRDRHCNQCQKYERAKWVEKQKVMLLPIPYFHIVFTTDHALNPLFRENKRAMYGLLFQVVSQTLQKFAREKLGCELGITAVLHTWGQKVNEHIHIHCIVTGGGLALDRQRWVRPDNSRYLFDVVELSAAYRDELIESIRGKYRKGEWRLSRATAQMDVEGVLTEIQAKKWEVFAKPFDDPALVYEYLSRYVHQVAISNYRLVKLEDGWVTFRYYENKERREVGGKGKEKKMRLPAEEFIRRLLLHILPPGFHRIRYYGLHHSSARKEKLPRSRELLGLERALPEVEELSLSDWLAEILGEDVNRCPNCGTKGSLVERSSFERLPWLVLILLSLVGQPTQQGVCR